MGRGEAKATEQESAGEASKETRFIRVARKAEPVTVPLAEAALVTVTTWNALLLWWVDEWSPSLGVVLTALAVIVDGLRRAELQGRLDGTRLRQGLERYLFPVLTIRWAKYLGGGVCALLLAAYFAFPEACPETLNRWLSSNFERAGRQLSVHGGACALPHGSVLLLTQAALSATALLIVAVLALSASFRPQSYLVSPRPAVLNPRSQIAVSIVGIVGLYIGLTVMRLALQIGTDEYIAKVTHFFAPHYSAVHFALFSLFYMGPLTFVWVLPEGLENLARASAGTGKETANDS